MVNKRSSHLRLFWAGLAATALGWIVCAYFAVPAVIVKAYSGESLAIFNHLIRGQANHPVTEYLERWNHLVSKMSLGLAVLGVYAAFAAVAFIKKEALEPSEPTGKVAMSRPRLWVVYTLGAVILGGGLFDLTRDTEHWPFSPYPMFSDLMLSRTESTLRLYGVVQRSPLVEIQLDNDLYLQPFDNSRLADAMGNALRENRVDTALTDCLTRYEALRRAGRHDGPPLIAMRLYKVTWTLDSSARNLDYPDSKDLLAEITSRVEGGD
jgi:hypothetical protein